MALPARFRLEGSVRTCGRTPFERDFLLSVRLEYLHIRFLAQLSLLDSLREASSDTSRVAEKMLALVVEGVLLRDQLSNAGSGIIWKVVPPA